MDYSIPNLPLPFDLETKSVLKQVALARTQLAELKGVAKTIPNELILINTLSLQEAKDSSEVEDIVTTQDDLYRYEIKTENFERTPAAKEVFKYREAIRFGFDKLRGGLPLTNNLLQDIQAVLVGNTAGFRRLPGTKLRDNAGTIVYTPPQNPSEVERYMDNLEAFINRPDISDWDPLVKLAVIHHQFESIHPFYDGNGRTGRILCILFLVASGLLDLPVLYLSRFITQNKVKYYGLLQAVRDSGGMPADWEAWVLFMLRGVEITARHTISIVHGIKTLMDSYKQVLRPAFGRIYKHELLNHLFFHPYTKIEYVGREMMVQRLAASKYLEKIVGLGLLEKVKIGRVNYYINRQLVDLLVNHLAIDG